MARELIAIYRTMYLLWFLVYQRVVPQQRGDEMKQSIYLRIQCSDKMEDVSCTTEKRCRKSSSERSREWSNRWAYCIQKERGETCGFQYFRKFRESLSWKKEMATLGSGTYGWNGGRSYSKKLKKWPRTRQRSLVYQWLITKITHGARQACCVTEFIRSRMPRPTSSPTRCSVSEV